MIGKIKFENLLVTSRYILRPRSLKKIEKEIETKLYLSGMIPFWFGLVFVQISFKSRLFSDSKHDRFVLYRTTRIIFLNWTNIYIDLSQNI